MQLDEKLVSALIAATVSLVVALLSAVASRRALAAERENLERQLQRRFTEKLYDLRLDHYPKIFEVTLKLRGQNLKKGSTALTRESTTALAESLDEWRGKSGFILSEAALEQFYALRRALRRKPASDGIYSPEQLAEIWRARVGFHHALRADIGLLHDETSNNDDEEA